MNYAALKDAIARIERAEQNATRVKDCLTYAQRVIRDTSPGSLGATYHILKKMMACIAWDNMDFEKYLLKPEFLLKSLEDSMGNVETLLAEEKKSVETFLKEGMQTDEIFNQKKAKATE